MLEKAKIFQYSVLGLFIALGLGGVICLSTGSCGVGPSNTTTVTSPTVIWGPPLKTRGLENFFAEQRNSRSSDANIFGKTTYVTKNAETLYSDLLEAIATGQGPDAVIMDASMLLALKDKVSVRPYDSYPLLTFQQSFVEGAEVFAQNDGIYAYPLAVDPLVLYWNRDLFTNAGIAQVPQDWTTLLADVPALTVRQGGKDLKQSAIAFGEFENVLNADDIVSALFFQTGSKIVQYSDGKYVPDLSRSVTSGTDVKPDIALRFFTDFSNPQKEAYTWNRTFARSREAFAANKVAMYAGPASEYSTIEKINPNLNYAVAMFPQSATGKNRATYGTFYAIAVLQSSKNIVNTHAVAQALASTQYAKTVGLSTGLPSARRDSLVEDPKDPIQSIAVRSALIARDWLKPDMRGVEDSMSAMVNNITSGKETVDAALAAFATDLSTMLERYNKL